MKTKNIALFALLLGTAAIAACGDDSSTGGGGSGTGGDPVGGGGGEPVGGAGGEPGSGGSGGSGGAQGPDVQAAIVFDAGAFELPEGLVVHGDDVVLGFALTGAVDRFALPGLDRSAFANAPPPPPNTSFITGLTFDPSDNLYVAYVSFTADAAPGIYRAGPDGGDATLWASDPQLTFPNGFAWDDEGLLYVTDSAAGAVFRVDADGNVSLWASDPVLTGDLDACGPHGDLAVGANGIVFKDGSFIVASSDQATVVRIPLEDDGSAGALETIVAPSCDTIAGLDGLTIDDDGTLVGAVNRSNRLVRIHDDGAVDVLFEGAPLDFPASLEFAGTGSDRKLYVTSFALAELMAGTEPHPALVTVQF